MKKVLALALALIMVLAMGVTSFAASITLVVPGAESSEVDWGFTWVNWNWDINNENVLIGPYNFGDFATLIDGTDTVEQIFPTAPEGDTLSSIKVESEKGLIDVTVYKLNDYVKSFSYNDGHVTDIKTKSSWPFDDFDLEDLVPVIDADPAPDYFDDTAFTWNDEHDEADLDLYFVYFDFPTYAGAKVSLNNYVTLKFRENTTGADYVKETEKLWFCIYPWAVYEDDVDTYADEDEAMELDLGYRLIPDNAWDNDDFADAYEDVTGDIIWIFEIIDPWQYADGESEEEPEIPYGDWSHIPYVIEKDSFAEIIGSTLIVGVDDDLEVEIGKIVKGQSGICFFFDTDVDDDVQALDEDAELAALNFLDLTNVLDSDFVITYTFPIEDAAKAGDYFLYELVGDQLTLVEKVAVGKGDDEVDVEIKREAGDTLGQYYLSDVELAPEAAPVETEENPNTGASEVAGVAVALAVISLVSAAAVALKK
ncbi:MAG TPA: hypothetical protein P5185_09030 [Oscillospiraceae bacterium]|nr:hypothetical protein [Oscillospiraceae bacterium]